MAHIAYPNNAHSVTVPSGSTYSYAHFPAGSAEEKAFKPTVLLLHGWPSSSHGWIYQIQHLVSLGFGVIAPDLLGYGQTSCPTDPEEYTFIRMGEDLISMLEMVGLRTNNKSIHVVGHDFGSLFLSYLVAKYPSLARSCVFVSVPYIPAGVKVDMYALKPMMEEALGFELFGYRRLLIQPDAWQLLDAHKDSLFSLGYSSEKLLISNFFSPGALEACLRADRQFPLEPWVTPKFKTTGDRIFQETGYRGSLLWLWYISRFGLHLGIVEEAAGGLELNIKCPVLFTTSAGGDLSIPTDMEKFANDYEFAGIRSSTGHWVHMEGRDEVNKVLAGFLGKK